MIEDRDGPVGRWSRGWSQKETIRGVEIDLVNKAMTASQFNQRKAAAALGLTYDQFRGYLKKYDLPTPSSKRG